MAKPIIPWLGGIIIPRSPPHTCYVEVFAGGAAFTHPAYACAPNCAQQSAWFYHRNMKTECPYCGKQIGGLKTIRQFCILDMYPSQEIVCLSCEHPIATNSHSYELISCIPFALAFLVCPLIAYNGAILLAVGASVVVILLAVAVYAWLSFARFVNGRDTVKPILFHEDDLSERSIRSSGAHPSHPQVTVVF